MAERASLLEVLRGRPYLLAALLVAVCLLHGCATGQLGPPTEASLEPVRRVTGGEIAFLALVAVPFTVATDLFILPWYMASHDDKLFFPLTRWLLKAVLR